MFELAGIGIVALVVAMLLPTRYLAIILGMVMPIDFMQGVGTGVFDFIRYALVLAIIVKPSGSVRPPRLLAAHIVLGILILLGLYALVSGLVAGNADELLRGVISIASALSAYAIARRPGIGRRVIMGFCVGMMASSLDIISQNFGGPYLGATTVYGIRYSGFSYSSTAVSPLIAIAFVAVLMTRVEVKSRALSLIVLTSRFVLLVVLGSALVISGGRGGLLGIALALGVLCLSALRGHPLAVLSVAVVGVVLVPFLWGPIAALLTRGGPAGFGSGRAGLNSAAWQAFLGSPVFGVDPARLSEFEPHTPIINFAIQAGFVGLICGIGLVAIQVRIMVANPYSSTPVPVAARMMCAVMLAISFLEPDGFFVGLSRVVILMIVVTAYDRARDGGDHLKQNKRPFISNAFRRPSKKILDHDGVLR